LAYSLPFIPLWGAESECPPSIDSIIQGLPLMSLNNYVCVNFCIVLLVATPSLAQEGGTPTSGAAATSTEPAPPAPADIHNAATTPAPEAQAPPKAAAPEANTSTERMVRVTHQDGRISEGKLLEMHANFVLMRLGAGRLLRVTMTAVISVETWRRGDTPPPTHQVRPATQAQSPEHEPYRERASTARAFARAVVIENRHDRTTWRPDPNRTRYLFAPSAYTLDVGDGYFSQKQLGLSEVAFAVHDDVTLLVGGVIPTWFMEEGFNLVMGLKAGLQVAENLHWAAGVYGVLVPPTLIANAKLFGGGGIAFTTLTWGSEHFHGSFSVGMPFIFQGDGLFYDPVLVLAGNFRVSPGLALVTEHWVIPSLLAQDFDSLAGLVNTAALRFVGTYVGNEWSVDLGLVRVHGLGIPVLPWLDVTYNWGT
jgi:hypothetical protein